MDYVSTFPVMDFPIVSEEEHEQAVETALGELYKPIHESEEQQKSKELELPKENDKFDLNGKRKARMKAILAARNKEINELKSCIKDLYFKAFRIEQPKLSLDVQSTIFEENPFAGLCWYCKLRLRGNSKQMQDIGTQTFESDFLNDDSTASALDWVTEGEVNVTVSSLVQDAVGSQSDSNTDYVYDENYKMYYNASSGYYYDSVKDLWYEPYSQTYYKYDSKTGVCELYQTGYDSQNTTTECTEQISGNVFDLTLDDNAKNQSISSERKAAKCSKRRAKKNGSSNNSTIKNDVLYSSRKERVHSLCDANSKAKSESNDSTFVPSEDSSIEDGEIQSDSSLSCTSSKDKSELSLTSSPTTLQFDEGPSEKWPPCIRAIVKESTHDKVGSLVLITRIGGIIGRDVNNAVCLEDPSISREHAKVTFDDETWQYGVIDLGSQNGTYINGTLLLSHNEQKPHPLNHGDALNLGSCELLIHIHAGSSTCKECEPGLVQAELAASQGSASIENVVETKEMKEQKRRKNLKQIKKKFGLQDMNFVSGEKAFPSQSYQDRSQIRRKEKGSQNPYEKSEQTASLETALPDTNKGYKMLKTMGWTEGHPLGNSESGIVEPVQVQPQSSSKAGLGSGTVVAKIPEEPRRKKWRKAQQRYRDIEKEEKREERADFRS